MFKKLISQFLNRETILYCVFGVLTTVVDVGSFWILCNIFGVDSVIAIVPAWVLAVLFAFVTDKLFVFVDRNFQPKVVMREFALFLFARLLSLLYAILWQAVATKWLHLGPMVSKLLGNIVVLIMNYIASKLIIFKDKGEKTDEKAE